MFFIGLPCSLICTCADGIPITSLLGLLKWPLQMSAREDARGGARVTQLCSFISCCVRRLSNNGRKFMLAHRRPVFQKLATH